MDNTPNTNPPKQEQNPQPPEQAPQGQEQTPPPQGPTPEQQPQQKKEKKLTGKLLPKNPKFSYYWIYAVIAVLLLGLQFFSFRSTVKETDEHTFFQEMLKSHDVDNIMVVNNEIVEVYLKESRLANEKYKDVSQTSWGGVNKGPHYYFTIG